MKQVLSFFLFFLGTTVVSLTVAQPRVTLKKSDLKKDVLMQTDSGHLILRLKEETPLHRDNFIRLVKSGYYNGISFHRVISGFMIQAGDEKTKIKADSTKFLKAYTLPAEISPDFFHKKGMLAAARMGDNVNPTRESSGVQFYIVQGRVFNDKSLDSVETYRLNGRKIPVAQREVYKTTGGAPHLDQTYTIFGELVSGYDVLDKIAQTKTSGRQGGDKPMTDIRIKKAKLIRRRTL
jgi:cyclophilin family peptidyl-prolyl cis-trans isomerase